MTRHQILELFLFSIHLEHNTDTKNLSIRCVDIFVSVVTNYKQCKAGFICYHMF